MSSSALLLSSTPSTVPSLAPGSAHHDSHPLTVTPATSSSDTNKGRPLDGYVRLLTTHCGYVYEYDQDPFVRQSHMVMECVSPPPVTLALGMEVALESVRGRLTSVYGVKSGQARFILQPDIPYCAFVVLQVRLEFARLPWHWRARVALYRLVGREGY